MRLFTAALVAAFLLSPAQAQAVPKHTDIASFYGTGFHGKRTASGARYDQNAHTCAHRSAPFGTRIKVTYQGRSTVCTVTDRGPFVAGRTIDLSVACAREIGLISAGFGKVILERLH